MKGTLLAGVAALMLSAPVANGMLEKVQKQVFKELELGEGDCMKRAEKGDLVTAHLRVRIDEESAAGTPGELLGDSRAEEGSVPFSFIMGDYGTVLPALDYALEGRCTGEGVRVRVPSKDAYGAEGVGAIPGHADVEFEVEIIGVRMPNKTAMYDEKGEQQVELRFATPEDVKEVPVATKPLNSDTAEEVDEEAEEVESKPEPEPKVTRTFKPYFIDEDPEHGKTDKEKKDVKRIDHFATIDDDKDGWITLPEYEDYIRRSNLRWSYWRAVFLFQDEDGDSKLSWWEWTGPKGPKPPKYLRFDVDENENEK